MADDDARARRTTKATAGAKKATVKKAVTPPVRKAATKKAAPAAKSARAQKAAPAAKSARAQKAAPAARSAPAKKAPAKKAPAKKAPAKKAARVAKAAPAARVAKAASSAANRGAILAPRAKKAPSFRPAAEQTLEDDWEPPAPEPVREDPHARIRSLLRAAAAEVEGRAPSAARPRPAPPAPPQPDEEVTRVLVAPAPPEEDEWLADDEVEAEELEEEVVAEQVEDDWDDDELPEDDEDDWSAPEILEEAEDEDEDEMLTVASAPSPTLSAPPTPARGRSLPTPTPPSPAPAPSPATDFTPPPFEVKPAKERKAGRSRLKVLFIVLAGLVGLAALFVGALWAYDNFRDEGIDYSELKVGDCFDSSASNEIRGIEVKPCSEPHNSEIFFIVTHPAGPTDAYPGKDALVQYAADNCLGQPLTDYLGIPLEQSKLKDFEIVPQESAWKDGRRVLVCGLDTGGEGDITGSVKGTRR